ANGNRPDATRISPFPAHPTPQHFWYVAAFNANSPDLTWRPGNVNRETLRRPGLRQADLSLARNVRIHENHSLNGRFEAFNATNHPNWNTPSADARSASTFGVNLRESDAATAVRLKIPVLMRLKPMMKPVF